MENIFVYVNVKGRIIVVKPKEVREHYIRGNFWKPNYQDGLEAVFDKQVCAEEKKSYGYVRILDEKPGVIRNHTIWYDYPNFEGAKMVFQAELDKKIKKISKQYDNLLEEKEKLEKSS